VKIEAHSKIGAMVGAVPKNADTESILNFDDYFQITDTKRTDRFDPAFWAAFRKSPNGNLRRFLFTDLPISFEEISPEEVIPPQSIEIPRLYIANDANSDDVVINNIHEWAKKLDFDLKIAMAIPSKSDSRFKDPIGSEGNLLGQIFRNLEPEELSRISIPLDIAKKLYDTKV